MGPTRYNKNDHSSFFSQAYSILLRKFFPYFLGVVVLPNVFKASRRGREFVRRDALSKDLPTPKKRLQSPTALFVSLQHLNITPCTVLPNGAFQMDSKARGSPSPRRNILNASTDLTKNIGYGGGYEYDHNI